MQRASHLRRQTLSLGDPPPAPRVTIQTDGQVVLVMFGSGSAAPHFHSRTCTEGPGGRVAPAASEGAVEVNLNRPVMTVEACDDVTPTKPSAENVTRPAVSADAARRFYDELEKSGARSAVLSILPGYGDSFVPRSVLLDIPPPLTELFDPKFVELPFPELMERCGETFQRLGLGPDQASHIELETRRQVNSKLWLQMVAGRITASRFKAAASADLAHPAVSLIQQIVYPPASMFSSATPRCRCKHEAVARKLYEAQAARQHADVTLKDSGFHIHPDYPHLGASPHALLQCSCCGRGLLEVKCPCCEGNSAPVGSQGDGEFCLESSGGVLSLKKDHAYYYQVQAQLNLAEGRDFCDFVMWREREVRLFIQRIFKDPVFFQNVEEKVTAFYKVAVLPELLGRWYTRTRAASDQVTPGGRPVCYCRQPERSIMVQCQSGFCGVLHFHLKCLGLKKPPKCKVWLCPNCRKVSSATNKTAD